MSPKLRGWLILTRGSNLPTVWSNVLAGWLLAQGLRLRPPGSEYAGQAPDPLGWGGLLLLLLGVSLTYVGGMILNDAFDARWDAERRSTRPIPAGLIAVGEALRAGARGTGLARARGLGHRHAEPEARAPALLAREAGLAAHGARDAAQDGQAEARAAMPARARGVPRHVVARAARDAADALRVGISAGTAAARGDRRRS